MRTSSRLLEDSKVEHDNVIHQLKEKLALLRYKSGKNFQGQTRETNESIESHLHVVKSLFETYSDILPAMEKSVKEADNIPEFQFDPDTMEKIYLECNMTIPSDKSFDNLSQKSQKTDSNFSEESNKSNENKGFGWNILSKFSLGFDDSKSTSTKSQNSSSKRNGNGNLDRKIVQENSIDGAKEWEIEIFRPILGGMAAKALDKKITHLIESGNYVPPKNRGLLWRKLVSNRGRINRRLFKLLLGLLDKASPSVRESIIKDMDRTYGEFKTSQTYCDVKNESIKVLQLFDVVRRLPADTSARYRLHPGHVLYRRRSSAEHEHISCLQNFLQPGLQQ